MKEIYASDNLFQLNVIKHFLERHDILSHVEGEYLQGAYSGMRFSRMSLMVMEDDFETALKLLEDHEKDHQEL